MSGEDDSGPHCRSCGGDDFICPDCVDFVRMVKMLQTWLEKYPVDIFPPPGTEPGSKFVNAIRAAVDSLGLKP